MKYSFQILSEENENFLRVIEIDENDTFLSLHNAIQDSVGYDKTHLASFFTVDENFDRLEEIALMDMSDDDDDVHLMEKVKINEMIEEEGEKILYMFDFLNDRSFVCMLEEITEKEKNFKNPVCVESRDDAPDQLGSEEDDDFGAMLGTDLKDLEREFSQLAEKGASKGGKSKGKLSKKDDLDDLYDDDLGGLNDFDDDFDDDYDDGYGGGRGRFDNIDDYADNY